MCHSILLRRDVPFSCFHVIDVWCLSCSCCTWANIFPLGVSLWLFMCEFLIIQSIVKTLQLLISPPTYLSHLPMPSTTCDAYPVLLAEVCLVSQVNSLLPRYPLSTYIIVIHHQSFYHWSVPDGPSVPLLSLFLVVVQFSVCLNSWFCAPAFFHLYIYTGL
jgi:hypothetical protein